MDNSISFDEFVDSAFLDKDVMLPSIISSLHQENVLQERLCSIRTAIKFFSAYEIAELEEKVLQYVMTAIKRTITEALEVNNSRLKSSDDLIFSVSELKENLELTIDLLDACCDILTHLRRLGVVQIDHLRETPIHLSGTICLSFQHCKISHDLYTGKLDTESEIIKLFRKTQELHCGYLKWLEECLQFDSGKTENITILCRILALIVNTSEILTGMNVKSLADNWKGYTAMIQKYNEALIDNESYSIELPLKYLTNEIKSRVLEIMEQDLRDNKQLVQSLKILQFLYKVSMKICDLFWRKLEKYGGLVVAFVLALHNVNFEYFVYNQCDNEALQIVHGLGNFYKQFTWRLFAEEYFLQAVISSQNIEQDSLAGLGVLSVMSSLVEFLSENYNTQKVPAGYLISVLKYIFKIMEDGCCLLTIDPNLYENLLINTAALIIAISHDDSHYRTIEDLLLEQVVRESLWPALLAGDIWCLILKSLPHQREVVSSFSNLLEKFRGLNFGTFTHRTEFVCLKVFVRRVSGMIPGGRAVELLETKPRDDASLWRLVGFQNFISSQGFLIESLFAEIGERNMRLNNLTPQEFVDLLFKLEAISSIDVNKLSLNYNSMIRVILDLWRMDLTEREVFKNHFFQHFLKVLCRATRAFIKAFYNTNLILVLNQLKLISEENEFKLSIIDLLAELSGKTIDFTQEQHLILSIVSELIESMIRDSNPITQQMALECFDKYVKFSPHNETIINCVCKNLKTSHVDLDGYMNRQLNHNRTFSFDYYKSSKYQHRCLVWSGRGVSSYKFKSSAMKMETEKAPLEEVSENKQAVKKFKTDDNEGEVDSLINSIKAEMKSLAKAARKEPLNKKNISDLNYIVNQLRSIAQQ